MRARTILFSVSALHAVFLLLCRPLYSQDSHFEKLSPTINDPIQSEALPVISIDGKRLFFTRARLSADGSTVFDVWRSFLKTDGSFGEAEVLGDNLRSRFSIAVTSISPDNNSLYLIGKLQANTPPEDRVMVSRRTKQGWGKPTPIRIQGLKLEGAVTDYSFGPDQRTLIMSLKRDSTLGERDLYVSFLDESSNSWTVPLWLGSDLNSAYTEATPYLSADNKTLYFSCDKPGGIGTLDVYRSTRLDDSWKHWSKPENLGPQINRVGRTSYYTEDAKGEFAYFVWRPDVNSQTDIYRTPAPKLVRALTLVSGKVHDDNGEPLEAEIRYDRLSDGRSLGLARSNPATGDYQITLPLGETYSLYAKKEGYLPASQSFDAKDANAFSTIEKDLVLVKIKENATIRLNNIFFETDKTALLPSSFAELDRLNDILRKDTTLRIAIEGHTDNTGSEIHNKALSLGRASAVVAYLISKGIANIRLESYGYAATKPIASNDAEEGKSKNRRVEFRVLEVGKK